MGRGEAARILLVGNEIAFLHGIEKLLREEGYICDYASEVGEAAVALERQLYDLLIADIDMPGNRELELVRTSQRNEYSVPAIVITGYPSVSTAVQSLHLAFVVEYLIKPVNPAELFSCVGPAVTTGRFWRVAFQAYNQLQAQAGDMGNHTWDSRILNGQRQAPAGFAWTLEDYLDQAGSHIVQFATNFRELLDAVKQGYAQQTTDICALLQCPRLAAYEEGLRDAVTVLGKPKNAFRWRALGALKERLEAMLKKARSV